MLFISNRLKESTLATIIGEPMADPRDQCAERIAEILAARGDDQHFSEAIRTRIHEHVTAFSRTTLWVSWRQSDLPSA